MRATRIGAALGAAVVCAGALAACGSDNVPGNAVARVGDTTITNSNFNHWMTVVATTQQAQTLGSTGAAPKVQIPQPPDFTACIANAKKTAPKPVKGQPVPTDAQYKKTCQQEYDQLRDTVLEFLISAQWLNQEAKDQGVQVTGSALDKQVATVKKQSFPKPTDYQTFLKQSGMSDADFKFRVGLDATSEKLRNKIIKGKGSASTQQIANYYNKNKSKFSQPEQRDLRLILTDDQGTAQKAKAAIQAGGSWSKLAKQYSKDQASKDQGGVLPGVRKGSEEPSLDKAVFAAPLKQLEGPVKTQFGYYIFQVQKITPASQQSLQKASPSIKSFLQQNGQQTALNDFLKDFQKKWRGKTNCRKGYVTSSCKNGPKPTTNTTAQQTAAPQQQQQVPQQQQQVPQQSSGGTAGGSAAPTGSSSGSSSGTGTP